jgi:hypothetical protein
VSDRGLQITTAIIDEQHTWGEPTSLQEQLERLAGTGWVETFDTDGFHDFAQGPVFTIPKGLGGAYLISATVYRAGVGARRVAIVRNHHEELMVQTITAPGEATFQALAQLEPGDRISVDSATAVAIVAVGPPGSVPTIGASVKQTLDKPRATR